MVLLANGWNVNAEWRPIQIICLTIFFVLLIGSLFLFAKLIIYKNILKNLTIASKEAEKIARNSLQNRLKRIDDIVTQTPNNLKKEALMVWRTEYKILIEKKFLEQITFIQKAFTLKKVTHATLKNLHQTKKNLSELQLISQKIYLIYKQTDKIMDLEMLQRDTRIKVRGVFNELKQDLDEVMVNPNFTFNRQKMLEKRDAIDQALTAINAKIVVGNNTLAEVYQQKTDEEIFNLIKLLDFFYTADKLLNNVLPLKITKIEKNMRTTILESNDLKKKLNKLYTLKEVFGLYKNQIFESLTNLDYHSSFQKLSYLSQLVTNFENDIQYEEKIKAFIADNLIDLNKIFLGLKTDLEKIRHSLSYNQKLGKNILSFGNQFIEIQKLSVILLRDWKDFYGACSEIGLYKKEFSLPVFESLLKQLLETLKPIYQNLIEISRSLKTKNNLRDDVDNKLFEVRAVLTTTEVVINKNADQVNCDLQKEKINEIYTVITTIANDLDYKNNRLDVNNAKKLIEALEKLIEAALEVKSEVRNKVLLATLAESLILYLDHFSIGKDNTINLEELLKRYENNEWNDILNLGVYHLQNYRK